MNRLALAWDDPEVAKRFVEILGVRALGEPPREESGDAIVDFRSIVRRELGFGRDSDPSQSVTWIVTLDGVS